MFLVRELSEEEKMMIVLSEDFQRFVYHTAPIVERALAEDVDIYTDYTGGADREDTGCVFYNCYTVLDIYRENLVGMGSGL